mmetsp:Transcript_82077/g.254808  ORF Transcript_82077/g.254808 Transcript_82077/m.254808 type:complete len:243 (+) Transcript_82077:107-835(+)
MHAGTSQAQRPPDALRDEVAARVLVAGDISCPLASAAAAAAAAAAAPDAAAPAAAARPLVSDADALQVVQPDDHGQHGHPSPRLQGAKPLQVQPALGDDAQPTATLRPEPHVEGVVTAHLLYQLLVPGEVLVHQRLQPQEQVVEALLAKHVSQRRPRTQRPNLLEEEVGALIDGGALAVEVEAQPDFAGAARLHGSRRRPVRSGITLGPPGLRQRLAQLPDADHAPRGVCETGERVVKQLDV